MWSQLRARPGIDLSAVDPQTTPGFDGDRAAGEAALAAGVPELSELQEMLFARSRAGDERRILLVLQAMDTAGKGGIVKHVVGAVDPQGVALTAFKAPTEEERAHDFLWRIRPRLPGPGMLGVFDRSHYEDVLIHRVRRLSTPAEVERRYGAIVDFEREVAAAGTTIVKVMLHLSREEQGRRLAERLDRPDKHWKYNPGMSTSASTGTPIARRTRSRSRAPTPTSRRGSWCRRIASGSRDSRCSPCCSRPCGD